jgi:hypothetical protein
MAGQSTSLRLPYMRRGAQRTAISTSLHGQGLSATRLLFFSLDLIPRTSMCAASPTVKAVGACRLSSVMLPRTCARCAP